VSKNVYVGNMSYETTRERLITLFASHGQVASVNVITDRATGRPRGFAFVEMTTEEAANAAIAALNGQEVDGRTLTVDAAKPRAPRNGNGGASRGASYGGARGSSRRW
jgi:cold-inducible RNA-binding protein